MSAGTGVQAFSRAALPATPWKNGGGTTQEIAGWPAGAGLDAFGWRVSIACIAASGPFSVFAGIDRSIMPQPAWTATPLTFAAPCLIDQAYRAATGGGACPARVTVRRAR